MSATNQKLQKDQFVNHYQIISRLGTGGMGEVYLAEDSVLGRKVALKILSVESEKNQDFLRRFKQEARATSALNHPNIITIYQIGEWENANYIAMEYVEGRNLRSIMRTNGLNISTALDITAQVASALSAAHSAGIIHRDIKPENIMLRPDGIVKVLDFGLAKNLSDADAYEFDVDNEAATREYLSTIPGLVMGTVQYMSPEQARGVNVDSRTDVWSLGVCLYEMITGVPPFTGETKTDLLASILKTEPLPLSHYVPDIPVEIQHIITKALGKDLEERYQVIKDLTLDMKILQSHLSAPIKGLNSTEIQAVRNSTSTKAFTAANTEAIAPANKFWFYLPLALLIAVLGAAGFWYFRYAPDSGNKISLASQQIEGWRSEIGESITRQARFSPDGRFLAYIASKNGKSKIWIKQLQEGQAFTREADNDEQQSSPLWSPDGDRLAFYSERGGQRGIWAMPAFGGSIALLSPIEVEVRLVKWTKDNSTIFFEKSQNLYSLNVLDKQINQLTSFDTSHLINRNFRVSPDEQKIVYTDRQNGIRDVWIADINGANATRITNDESDDWEAVWHPDGKRILYTSSRNGIREIFLAYLDGRAPEKLINSDSSLEVLDVSDDGSKILYSGSKDEADLWKTTIDGDSAKETQITSELGVEFWYDISPDGQNIVYQSAQTVNTAADILRSPIFTQKIDGNSRSNKFTDDAFSPRWSPDGKFIAFFKREKLLQNLWVKPVSGGDAKQICQNSAVFGGYSPLPFNRLQTQDFEWSLNSQSIYYFSNSDGASNLWQTDLKTGENKKITSNDDNSLFFINPLLSPDNSQIAWISNSIDKNTKKTNWDIWILANGKANQIYRSNSALGFVGWSDSGDEIIIKSIADKKMIFITPTEIEISKIPLQGNNKQQITKLKSSYYQNICLSPNKRSLIFVSRIDNKDSLQIINLASGASKTLVESSDPRVYFSSVGFAPDGMSIYYGKQSNSQTISMINNFR